MKKIYSIIAGLLMTASVFAQAPEKMSYQAVVRDGSNALVASTAVGMQISILQGSASGTAVYVETQTPTSNANGLVSLEIGSGTVVSGDFTTIDWANGPFFIKTETDPTGGTSYTITGSSQLMSVPFALHAKTAETVTGGISETDPIFGVSVASGITGTDTANWNNHFSGDYNDLANTPSNVSTFTNDAGYLTSFTEVDGSVTNEIQDFQSVLATGNDGNAESIVNVSQITIGSSTPTPSTALEINSTQGTLLLPRMTTTQRDALTPIDGMIIYNTAEKKFQGYSFTPGSPMIDQQHLTINNGGGGDRAQSFTAAISGDLTAIELPFNTMMGTTDVNITIKDGDGTTGTVLHTQTFNIPGGGMTWYTFNISGVSVLAGNSYTIHVSEVTPNVCEMGPPCYDWGMDDSGDNYSGGLLYYIGSPYSIYDCAFKTYVSSGTTWINLH